MTKYSPEDYEWVKKIISRYSRGISVKDIAAISNEEGIRLGTRPRDEKPPGREKIYQIIKHYEGKDWDYQTGGGKGRHSVVKPIEIDPMSGLGHAAREMVISVRLRALEELYKKKGKKFTLLEIIEFYKIRESVISYPVRFLYLDSRQGHDKDILFNRAMGISKYEIRRIKRIETIQRKLNGRFDKTLRYLDQIRNSNLFEAEITGNRREYKQFLNPRNAIRTLYMASRK